MSHSAEKDAPECDVTGCNQLAVELVANDEPLLTPEYAERWVCRWHIRNAFSDESSVIPPGSGPAS